jgi:hypothetical protein
MKYLHQRAPVVERIVEIEEDCFNRHRGPLWTHDQ